MGKKRAFHRRRTSIRGAVLIGLFTTSVGLVNGCGSVLGDRTIARTQLLADCDAAVANDQAEVDLVVLDWTGGSSPIYPDVTFDALAFDEFETADGGTLADDRELFKELVRLEVSQIFCDWPEVSVVVQNGEDHTTVADTVVYISQNVPPRGGTDIGEAEYDPCNEQNDNSALIFGERIRQLGDKYTFDEWVTVFANVTAHEIGHTLGYGHVPVENRPEAGRTPFVELMLSRHTMTEMRMPQRLVVDQTNCDKDAMQGRQAIGVVLNCAVADHHEHE